MQTFMTETIHPESKVHNFRRYVICDNFHHVEHDEAYNFSVYLWQYNILK